MQSTYTHHTVANPIAKSRGGSLSILFFFSSSFFGPKIKRGFREVSIDLEKVCVWVGGWVGGWVGEGA